MGLATCQLRTCQACFIFGVEIGPELKGVVSAPPNSGMLPPMRDGHIYLWLLIALLAYCCGRESEADEPAPRVERIRLVLGAMPVSTWDRDEEPKARAARLDVLARAISEASRTDEEAAVLLAIGGAESGFAGYVQAGCTDVPPRASDCDGGLARSPWQMHEVACRPGWALSRGSEEALGVFAVCARKRFSGALRRCSGQHPGGDLAGAMAGYRSVDCRWEGRPHDGARARARLFALRLQQLRAAQ